MAKCRWIGTEMWVRRRVRGDYIARMGGLAATAVAGPEQAARRLVAHLCRHRHGVSLVAHEGNLGLWEITEEDGA